MAPTCSAETRLALKAVEKEDFWCKARSTFGRQKNTSGAGWLVGQPHRPQLGTRNPSSNASPSVRLSLTSSGRFIAGYTSTIDHIAYRVRDRVGPSVADYIRDVKLACRKYTLFHQEGHGTGGAESRDGHEFARVWHTLPAPIKGPNRMKMGMRVHYKII